ncbi:MAG: hypothetical protein KDN22_12275 [Verrucomicrobiae bacterium]|nr:hypothetical protein [Verrucomicrobiae bacterium]
MMLELPSFVNFVMGRELIIAVLNTDSDTPPSAHSEPAAAKGISKIFISIIQD